MGVTDRSSILAVDFLQRSLADGALAVGVLETQARAAGLLGESQQIQHVKAFKKAKKALAIRSIRNGFGSGGQWAWLMPPRAATEIGPAANAHLHTNEQTSLSDAEPPGKRVAASETSIVQQWIDGVHGSENRGWSSADCRSPASAMARISREAAGGKVRRLSGRRVTRYDRGTPMVRRSIKRLSWAILVGNG
jgi:hypothetical protein